MIEKLKKAGLTENESKVYLALLDLGPSLAGKISRRTGLHRRSVYDVTEMLIKKGLIGYILQNNRRVFHASSPQRILDIIEEKQTELSPIVSELISKYSSVKEKEETNFYKGKDGLKNVFEDQLNFKEVFIIGASPMAYDILQFYLHWHEKKRKQRKVSVKMISQSRKISKIPFTEIRYLPEKYQNPVSVNIYGDKVAILVWAKNNPLAIVIKNKEVADGYKNYFDFLWTVSKP